MKQENTRFARAALMLSAAAFFTTPALAQDATVAPPPVAQAAPEETVAPPPVARTVTPAATVTGDSATPVDPEAAAAAAAAVEDAERRAEARPARARPAVRAAAPVRAALVPAPAPRAPVAAQPAPVPTTQPPATQTEVAPATAASDPQPVPQVAETTQTTNEQGPALWPLGLIAALIVVAGAAFLLLRRRRAAVDHEVYAEPEYVAPVAAEPVMARDIARPAVIAPAAVAATLATDVAPVAADDASLAEPEAADVAALTAADTQGNRPWLEFAMRPVRAGTNVDEALVEIELTIGNAGNMDAQDVRISTFMLPAGADSEMERLLLDPRDDAAIAPITIAAGEGTRVDATLAMSRAELVNGATNVSFQPVIVADARYRLPDGSEGRTSASFLIGGTPETGTTLEPIALDRPLLREDVEARLYRTPERV